MQDPILVSKCTYDPGRRIYLDGERAYKLVDISTETTSDNRENTIAGEYEFLRCCEQIKSTPNPIEILCLNGFDVLVMQRMYGRELDLSRISAAEFVIILSKLTAIMYQISKLGVSHNDIISRNIILDENGNVHVVDFDQSQFATPALALVKNFLGLNIGSSIVYGSVFSLIRNYTKMLVVRKFMKQFGFF